MKKSVIFLCKKIGYCNLLGLLSLIILVPIFASKVSADSFQNPNQNLIDSVMTSSPKKAKKQKIKKKKTVYSHSSPSSLGSYRNYIHKKRPKLRAKAYIALDRKSGNVLTQKNSHHRYLVASTGKLMTIYLARRKLANHPKAWKKKLKYSSSLVRMARNPSLDGFHARRGHKYTLRTIMKSAIIDSDNNSAIRLGQWVGGSNKHFISMMNKQARLWHLKARFTSASGLENDDLARYGFWVKGGYYSGNLLSAKDLAVIAYHLVNDYPSIMKYFKTKVAYASGQRLVNQNRILPGQKYYIRSLQPDGLKTGYTPRSGLCFVGTCNKKRGLITVVINDPNEFSDTDKLMKYTYKHMHKIKKSKKKVQKQTNSVNNNPSATATDDQNANTSDSDKNN
ncbi:serine hydrolase [Lactobacillus sp. ESL0791]|uniref:D-alanyl-D-alanine carboxypeptidase family protein n=1 Tax=Lactobacillus sp. ESL0791 TaxID=2983234 RepID=UPI0023FA431B|nr:serine hydrolase [Lactobacillus sp. ESL0791]MDF7639731.1 serine hydrolase [Lactobacillus sp. ESL0791]